MKWWWPLYLLWTLPESLFGALILLLGKPSFICWNDGIAFYSSNKGGLLNWWFDRFQFAGITCGGFIFLKERTYIQVRQLVVHELRHVRQGWWLGPVRFICYGVASLVSWALGQGIYRGNIFEKDARRAAGEKV